MSRIKQATVLSGQMVREMGGMGEAAMLVNLPPIDWYARGPRGGVHLATGARTRSWSRVVRWDYDEWVVLDESEDSRYIRPGTRRHREATK